MSTCICYIIIVQLTTYKTFFTIIDCLSSVHVANEVLYLIEGSHAQSLDWSQLGLKLHFLENTVSNTAKCEVAIKVLVGGEFQFPPDCQLISAVYAISFAKNLEKSVKLEIQHCASLKSKEQFQYLSFVRAPMKPGLSLFEFTLVDGGKFSLDSQYGSITQNHFSLTAIVKFAMSVPLDLAQRLIG